MLSAPSVCAMKKNRSPAGFQTPSRTTGEALHSLIWWAPPPSALISQSADSFARSTLKRIRRPSGDQRGFQACPVTRILVVCLAPSKMEIVFALAAANLFSSGDQLPPSASSNCVAFPPPLSCCDQSVPPFESTELKSSVRPSAETSDSTSPGLPRGMASPPFKGIAHSRAAPSVER